MKTLRVFLITACLFFVSAFSVSLTNAQSATTSLGGLDLNRYCASIGQGSASLSTTGVWSCTGNNQAIVMTSACQWQYKNSSAYAIQNKAGDPYSYACFVGVTPTATPTPTPTGVITSTPTPTPTPSVTTVLGGLDLNRYCASIGQGSASLSTTGVWSCTGNNQAIVMTSACQWQYNPSAFASNSNPGNPYSWICEDGGNITPTVAPTITPTPTSGIITILGGINLNGYCAHIGQGNPSLSQAGVWSCTGNGLPINMTNVCQWQYNPNAYAFNTNNNSPYSWICEEGGTIPTPTPTSTQTDDWTMYKYNIESSNFNTLETAINGSTAANLKVTLDIPPVSATAAITVQPAVVNNTIYYGDWDGTFYARDMQGNVLWSRNLGVDNQSANGCHPPIIGIESSASVQIVTINGKPTSVVYVGGGDGNMYALLTKDGSILWKTQLTDTTTGGFIWDSPAAYNGSLYEGIASFCDSPLIQGKFFKINEITGAIQATANLVPNGCHGAGEWGSPTIDPEHNSVYITTGTQNDSCLVNGQQYTEPNALALVELDASSLNILGSFRIPPAELGPDSDFGVSPVLSTGIVNGVKTELVSAPNKNGRLYIFKRGDLTKPVVDMPLGLGGQCPQCGQGSISAGVFDGKVLYQGTGSTALNSVNYVSSVMALNPGTGAILWQHGFSHPVVAALTMVNGVLFVPNGDTIDVLNPANGNEIIKLTLPNARSIFYAPVAVARGKVFAGNLNGNFYILGL